MINRWLFHAEGSRNEIGLLSEGLQFNSIDEAMLACR